MVMFILLELLMTGDICVIEIVFDRALVAPRHEDDVLDPRGNRLVHDVLDRRPIEHRQHLLWDCFRGWKHARAEAGDWQYRFP